jgi:putative transposase
MSRGERKAMIAADRPGLSRQCRLLSISRPPFYYPPTITPRGESTENLALIRRIGDLFLKYPFYGSRQMARPLRRENISAGRPRVRRLIRRIGLDAISPAPGTSTPHPPHRIYPYLLGSLTGGRRDPVWCAGIPCIPVRRGFLSLIAIIDWAARHVLAWLSNTIVKHPRCLVLRRGRGRGDGRIRQARNMQL